MIIKRIFFAAVAGLATIGVTAVHAHSGKAVNTAHKRHFAVHQVDAEAGVHPRRPNPLDRRALSDDGHAYWMRKTPILEGGLIDVSADDSGRTLTLRVSDRDGKLFGDYSTRHINSRVAIVVDGRIVGEPMTVMTPITGTSWSLAPADPLLNFARCLAFEDARDRPTADQRPTNCHYRQQVR